MEGDKITIEPNSHPSSFISSYRGDLNSAQIKKEVQSTCVEDGNLKNENWVIIDHFFWKIQPNLFPIFRISNVRFRILFLFIRVILKVHSRSFRIILKQMVKWKNNAY